MEIENILKIADIAATDLSEETVKFLCEDVLASYEDTSLYEHIYNIEDIKEDIDLDTYGEVSTLVIDEIDAIATLITANDCGYFRVTF